MSQGTSPAIPGLHHVTAISGPPQGNLDFWVRILGQRLVKRTVNFDDPGTYHLYYGDQNAAPGSIMTFFPFVDAGPGRAGAGMASAVAYAIPDLDLRMGDLAEAAIDFEGPFERFGEPAIAMRDPDGLRVELIEGGARDGGVIASPSGSRMSLPPPPCSKRWDMSAKPRKPPRPAGRAGRKPASGISRPIPSVARQLT
ncbi:Catechol 2,3-dioxygenase [Loktanella salsilacus]|jgi:glyoxalase family protein|uniref:Catechol 2,3-dioxygenase n=1 Tax=Loktanella salsilacus TaxID=195913 RepID=A0A1I4JAW4_9RHOB|nr:VOC family protein [Loktanella salsilacus]SFL63722.1 Catechol 2,3-dioxygenase [Loktanella salsilacus]